MSTAPEHQPDPRTDAQPDAQSGPRSGKPRRDPAAALVFDDPLAQQSSDDTDRGWGERPSGGGSDDLARFLDEKPPHHI
ncbi:hypothetical protein QMK19_21730 [Streptomyces sp. H10-C2]|uniref:hypothetical protein n=1 Tax=unclassified Streptomyces TaxID=2593676 RepID=UPI0024BAD7C6|nr:MULTISPECIES: hypothetical protein [unclassified Streptomyces]MDJ0342357.1 hypothetical protein [Streptomyces sp. PH10-H1]MDJ0372212.1 hypothetical protein [Streptomyces sp. H10-C2]